MKTALLITATIIFCLTLSFIAGWFAAAIVQVGEAAAHFDLEELR